jgi:hypothetical protein
MAIIKAKIIFLGWLQTYSKSAQLKNFTGHRSSLLLLSKLRPVILNANYILTDLQFVKLDLVLHNSCHVVKLHEQEAGSQTHKQILFTIMYYPLNLIAYVSNKSHPISLH